MSSSLRSTLTVELGSELHQSLLTEINSALFVILTKQKSNFDILVRTIPGEGGSLLIDCLLTIQPIQTTS